MQKTRQKKNEAKKRKRITNKTFTTANLQQASHFLSNVYNEKYT